MKLQKKI